MELEFIKMHGLGNDFIFVDDLSAEIELTEEQVRGLCERHFGIGADGVILVRPPQTKGSLAYMHYINADGSLAQMCGNGVRCFAKYLVDRGFADIPSGMLTAGTMAGERDIRFEVDSAGKMVSATVDMGSPELDPVQVPVDLTSNAVAPDGSPCVREALLDSPWGPFPFTCVSMGNPHGVCFVDDWDQLPDGLFTDATQKGLDTLRIDEIGAWYESHGAFPEKANIEFACCEGEGIAMRVYERGCGETFACGTGACATLVTAILTGRVEEQAPVRLLGGTLDIRWDGSGSVFMTGPASESFSGTVEV